MGLDLPVEKHSFKLQETRHCACHIRGKLLRRFTIFKDQVRTPDWDTVNQVTLNGSWFAFLNTFPYTIYIPHVTGEKLRRQLVLRNVLKSRKKLHVLQTQTNISFLFLSYDLFLVSSLEALL